MKNHSPKNRYKLYIFCIQHQYSPQYQQTVYIMFRNMKAINENIKVKIVFVCFKNVTPHNGCQLSM